MCKVFKKLLFNITINNDNDNDNDNNNAIAKQLSVYNATTISDLLSVNSKQLYRSHTESCILISDYNY